MKLKLVILFLIIILVRLPMIICIQRQTVRMSSVYQNEKRLKSQAYAKLEMGFYKKDLNLIKEAITEGTTSSQINKTLLKVVHDNNLNIIEFLLKNGADINSYDEKFGNPLMSAARNRNINLVKFLINNEANINVKTPDNTTPLMQETKYGHEEMVDILLISGADINQKNNKGETALDIAIKYNHENIIKTLKEWPIKVKYIQKHISQTIKEAGVIPNIIGIRNIIAEYTIGMHSEK